LTLRQPYFNAPIYLENKSSIGKVDEILGPINEVYFTIKPSEGIVAGSFKAGDKVYIGGDKLLPLDRFIPKPKVLGPKSKDEAAFEVTLLSRGCLYSSQKEGSTRSARRPW
jgi:H/ACA ribonucleoprotein complex subunit 1